MYSYIGDVSLLCGVEDIDNLTLEERPKMFDSVARPYVLAYGDVFSTLPSCGVGGPNAQAAEAEKILSCNPDIVISEYEDVEKEDALQEQLGVPVVTLKSGPERRFRRRIPASMTLLGQIFGEEEKAEGARILHRGGDRRDRRAHHQHCRRGQARRLRLRSRQLGHHEPPHDLPDLRLL